MPTLTALAARVTIVQIGSTWTNLLGWSRVDPPAQRRTATRTATLAAFLSSLGYEHYDGVSIISWRLWSLPWLGQTPDATFCLVLVVSAVPTGSLSVSFTNPFTSQGPAASARLAAE